MCWNIFVRNRAHVKVPWVSNFKKGLLHVDRHFQAGLLRYNKHPLREPNPVHPLVLRCRRASAAAPRPGPHTCLAPAATPASCHAHAGAAPLPRRSWRRSASSAKGSSIFRQRAYALNSCAAAAAPACHHKPAPAALPHAKASIACRSASYMSLDNMQSDLDLNLDSDAESDSFFILILVWAMPT